MTLFFFTCTLCAFDAQNDANEKTSKESTTLYRSARGVISKSQAVIDDASKGDKGLSGDKVYAQALKTATTKLGYEPKGKHIDGMKTAIVKTMAGAQDLINEKGKGFKGFLPAIFAKKVGDNFNVAMNGKMKIKLTAPKAYVRNRANRPDKWEHKIIEKKFKDSSWVKDATFSEIAKYKGKDVYRSILPEYYKESCLNCHGSPKGERDKTGGLKEGGKLGELGGAISFMILQD